MDSVQAIYENGVLRPLTPLQLPEKAEVTIAVFHDRPASEPFDLKRHQQARDEMFEEIQKLPQSPTTDGLSNRDHDLILYGWQK